MINLSINASKLYSKINLIAPKNTPDIIKVPSVVILKSTGKFNIYESDQLPQKIAKAIEVALTFNTGEDFRNCITRWFTNQSQSICNIYNVLKSKDEVALIVNIPFKVRLYNSNKKALIDLSSELSEFINRGQVE